MTQTEGITTSLEMQTSGLTAGLQKVKSEMTGFAKTTEQTASQVEAASVKTEMSIKQLGLGMSQTMTSGFALYSVVDDIEKKQYALDKANLAVVQSNQSLVKAQNEYNAAVEKFGMDSPQAVLAQQDLQMAQEKATLAADRADISQGNLNDQMTMAALTVIPSVISGVDGMSKMWKQFQGLNISSTIGGIGEAFKAHKGSVLSFGLAMGAMAPILLAFTSGSNDMKIGMSLLAGAMIAAASAQWIYNIAAVFGLEISTLGMGAIIVGVAAASAAAIYLLSSTYGAKADNPQANIDTATAAANSGSSSSGGGNVQYPSNYLGKDAMGRDMYDVSTPGAGTGLRADGSTPGTTNMPSPDQMNFQTRWELEQRGWAYDAALQKWVSNQATGANQTVINYWNIDGARDVDVTQAAIARNLGNAGIQG